MQLVEQSESLISHFLGCEYPFSQVDSCVDCRVVLCPCRAFLKCNGDKTFGLNSAVSIWPVLAQAMAATLGVAK